MKPNKLKKIKKSVKLQYRNIDISTFGLLSVAYPAELDDLFFKSKNTRYRCFCVNLSACGFRFGFLVSSVKCNKFIIKC